jgi:hypothetical protein
MLYYLLSGYIENRQNCLNSKLKREFCREIYYQKCYCHVDAFTLRHIDNTTNNIYYQKIL